MFQFEVPTSFFGSYTVILVAILTYLLYKLFFNGENDVKNVPVVKKDWSEVKITQNKVIKKIKPSNCCSKKLKMKNNSVKILFTTELTKKLGDELKELLEEKSFECKLLELSTHFKFEEEATEDFGATIFILETEKYANQVLKIQKWLEIVATEKKKILLDNLNFSIFEIKSESDSSEVSIASCDRNLWQAGGRRLMKLKTMTTNEKAIKEEFNKWKQELLLVLNGKPNKASCVCAPKSKKQGDACDSGDSSCDSTSDIEDLASKVIKAKA